MADGAHPPLPRIASCCKPLLYRAVSFGGRRGGRGHDRTPASTCIMMSPLTPLDLTWCDRSQPAWRRSFAVLAGPFLHLYTEKGNNEDSCSLDLRLSPTAPTLGVDSESFTLKVRGARAGLGKARGGRRGRRASSARPDVRRAAAASCTFAAATLCVWRSPRRWSATSGPAPSLRRPRSPSADLPHALWKERGTYCTRTGQGREDFQGRHRGEEAATQLPSPSDTSANGCAPWGGAHALGRPRGRNPHRHTGRR